MPLPRTHLELQSIPVTARLHAKQSANDALNPGTCLLSTVMLMTMMMKIVKCSIPGPACVMSTIVTAPTADQQEREGGAKSELQTGGRGAELKCKLMPSFSGKQHQL